MILSRSYFLTRVEMEEERQKANLKQERTKQRRVTELIVIQLTLVCSIVDINFTTKHILRIFEKILGVVCYLSKI